MNSNSPDREADLAAENDTLRCLLSDWRTASVVQSCGIVVAVLIYLAWRIWL